MYEIFIGDWQADQIRFSFYFVCVPPGGAGAAGGAPPVGESGHLHGAGAARRAAPSACRRHQLLPGHPGRGEQGHLPPIV